MLPSPLPAPLSYQPERPHELRRFIVKLAAVTVVVPLTLAFSVASMLIAAGVMSGLSSGPSSSFSAAAFVGGTEDAENWVLAVPVEGPIASAGGGFGSTDGAAVRELLEEAADDPSIKAVVLELSTPGGTIPGSIDIAAGVEAVQAAGKPVVSYVADLSASGGVWAMSGSDRIIAHPGSVVGSVGVLYGPLRFYQQVTTVDDGIFGGGVTADGGIEEFYVTAGRGKDLGNPFRALTDDERADLQSQVDSVYADFLDQVTSHRPITRAELEDVFGARVMRAEDAEQAGLIDEIGSRQDAWSTAADLAGIEHYQVRRVEQTSGWLGALLGAQTSASSSTAVISPPRTLCSTTAQAVVFHGDLWSWCRSLGN